MILRRGALEATLYALPQVELGPGADIRVAEDATAGTTAAGAAVDPAVSRDAYAGHGLKLDFQPSWDVEIEDHFVRLNDDANPAAWGRTSGEYWATAFGLELRF